MQQKLYKNYVDDIEHLLRQNKNIKIDPISGKINESVNPKMIWLDNNKNEANFRSLSPINSSPDKTAKSYVKLGAHPSFSYLKGTNDSEYHYIVSMFIDVRNSTGLFKKYNPDVVANICRTIQLAAIHTCWYFDGYIHRLQGDGIMVYFGGKEISKKDAIDNALMAASFISFFVDEDLKDLFIKNDVKRVYTRIGLDFGEKADTLWHNAGIGEASEVTTTSLHTSLACKMQAQAENNGVMAGENILNYTSADKDLFEYKKYIKNGDELNYVFEIAEDNFRYKQYNFHWRKYLKNNKKVKEDEFGNLTYTAPFLLPTNPFTEKNIEILKSNASGYKPYYK